MVLTISEFKTFDGKQRFNVWLNDIIIRTVATRRGAEQIIRNLRREETRLTGISTSYPREDQ